jgi:hypothetical protein
VPFRKAYLRSLIETIEIDDAQVRIRGSKDELEKAVFASQNQPAWYSQASTKWRARREATCNNRKPHICWETAMSCVVSDTTNVYHLPSPLSYVVVYRAGSGRGAPVRRYTIAAVGKITPERARARAKEILGSVAHGNDPAGQKSTERGVPTVAELADRFMAEHIEPKRKAGTAGFYRDILDRMVKPAVGTTKADKLTRQQIGKLHSLLAGTPFQANRVLAVVGSMYSFAGRAGIIAEGTNPARGIDKFTESRRERFLTGKELERLGSAIREAETNGIPWAVDESKPNAKHYVL